MGGYFYIGKSACIPFFSFPSPSTFFHFFKTKEVPHGRIQYEAGPFASLQRSELENDFKYSKKRSPIKIPLQ
jgi:hypothetical protein